MDINLINGINGLFSANKTQETENKNLNATNSIFNDDTEFMGTKASTNLIDKMQTFFETLEKTDYDPKNSFFPGYDC